MKPQTASDPQPDAMLDAALKQYQRGDAKRAIENLRRLTKTRKGSVEVWHNLAVILVNEGYYKEARKAYEQMLKLSPSSISARSGLAQAYLGENKLREAEREANRALALDHRDPKAHFVLGTLALHKRDFPTALREAETALNADPDYSAALLLKTQALVSFAAGHPGSGDDKGKEPDDVRRARMREAEESLSRLIHVTGDTQRAAEWREQLEVIRFYTDTYEADDPNRSIFRANEVDGKAVITYKPEPAFAQGARYNNTQGAVRLRAVLAADGTVKHILVIKGLPDGLTEKAVDAARKIRFNPAVKDGRPVSQAIIIEYQFNLY